MLTLLILEDAYAVVRSMNPRSFLYVSRPPTVQHYCWQTRMCHFPRMAAMSCRYHQIIQTSSVNWFAALRSSLYAATYSGDPHTRAIVVSKTGCCISSLAGLISGHLLDCLQSVSNASHSIRSATGSQHVTPSAACCGSVGASPVSVMRCGVPLSPHC
jgi:hypothetical protein